ncbi:hypothetical protein CDAR_547801 [Caerostris darwini]|uniref:Uncharacterized protein n=1 Tax=Caerostris darwini TaxID=1538125 RepID=A0AAV4WH21_9ARAC|nr:hypothetical protein CDAR_547801 [Caerostris darwini]
MHPHLYQSQSHRLITITKAEFRPVILITPFLPPSDECSPLRIKGLSTTKPQRREPSAVPWSTKMPSSFLHHIYVDGLIFLGAIKLSLVFIHCSLFLRWALLEGPIRAGACPRP